MSPKTFWALLKETGSEWWEDNAQRLGAALAYYTVLSLAPLLIIAIAMAGLVFGQEAARREMIERIRDLVGEQGGKAIETMIESVGHLPSGVLPTITAIAILVVTATSVFGNLQGALNTIWEVQPKPGRGILGVVKDRFWSFMMVLGSGFLLLLSLLVSAALAVVNRFLGESLPEFIHLSRAADAILSLIVSMLLFAMIYKILPDVKMAWRNVWIGAAITSVLFTVGKFLIAFYLTRSNIVSAYGAAGSFVVLLVWTYYSAQVFLFGAEFTQVYAKRYGSGMMPDDNAVAVTEQARAQQGMPRTERVRVLAQKKVAETNGHGEHGA